MKRIVFHFETRDDLRNSDRALPAFLRVVRGTRQIAGEHHEVRRSRQRIDRGDRLLERPLASGSAVPSIPNA
jgi:hypothetical protein